MPRLIGLTGSFGSGKSAVAQMMREAGLPVLDADQAARDVVEPGRPALEEIVKAFGPDVLDDGGRLDRKRMAEIVFKDPAARVKLNGIVHPKVREEQMKFVQANLRAPAVVLEIPLLLETAGRAGFDAVIVVTTNERRRFGRLKGRGFGEREVIARLGTQLPQSRKAAMADHVIENSGTLDETRVQVMNVLRRLGLAGEASRGGVNDS